MTRKETNPECFTKASPIRNRINTCELARRATYSFVPIGVIGLLTEISASLSPVVKVRKTRTYIAFLYIHVEAIEENAVDLVMPLV